MKRTLIILTLMMLFISSASGQWYLKTYNVSDIDFLTKDQLEESLTDSKTGLLAFGIVAGMGAGMYLAARYLPADESEDPGILEQILGAETINAIIMWTGVPLFVGGIIGSIVYLGRMGTIRSALNRNFPVYGSIKISPALVLNRSSASYCPGLTLTLSF